MNAPDNFQVTEKCAFFRPVGAMSLNQGIELVAAAIAYSGEQKISRLLVDLTGLTGIDVPHLNDRYFFGKKFASASTPGFRLALVADPKLIDKDKFGVTVAANRGLRSDVFSDEALALTWLLSS
jgi:hypothetical protein